MLFQAVVKFLPILNFFKILSNGGKVHSYPFSENEMLVIGPECPGKFATFALSFKSQILMTLRVKSEKNMVKSVSSIIYLE